MYIKEVQIENIRSITQLKMSFEADREPGWHVILGDNGAGKSTLIRAIALGLIGPSDQKALRLDLREWLPSPGKVGEIWVSIHRHYDYDSALGSGWGKRLRPFWAGLAIQSTDGDGFRVIHVDDKEDSLGVAPAMIWNNYGGWFSVGFGPFRRFYGGDIEVMRVHFSDPRAAAHLSLFGENVALTEALTWMKELHVKRLEKHKAETLLLEHLIHFVNTCELLPFGVKIHEVNSEGVTFKDGNGILVSLRNLSDGFRSMLSLIFELIRELVRVYGDKAVFSNSGKDLFSIDLPGVVLIDEVDAHLHPTWQTRIGSWFTKYFPKMQFIVTTHSPLICRGASKGTIWKLSAPGKERSFSEIVGYEKDQLIYGNVLDAYETEEFGIGTARGEEGKALQKRYNELLLKRRYAPLDGPTTEEFNRLQQIFQSNVED